METFEGWESTPRAYGIEAVGVCGFEPLRERLLPCRAAARLPERACRVIVALFPYRFPEEGERNLSRYACVEDYHGAGGAVLRAVAGELARRYPPYAFEPFLDNSPIPEVAAAVRCGLGAAGDNGLLIHPVYGSYVFIGTVVTDAPLPVTPEAAETGCLHCGRCAAACPGGCLPGSGRTSCVSALSQKKGELSAAEEERLRRGGLVWGCDACQEACPLNEGARIAPHPCFTWYRPVLREKDLDDLTGKAYGWRGKAAPLRNLRLLRRQEEK